MPISVRIPTENMTAIAINWSLAKCSCPSWSANADESALRSSLASLDTCNSSLHWWLGFWTFLVAFGVALEVVFVVWEYLEELHDLRRCLIHPPKRPTTALFVLGLLGAGLVAAGVSGEFWKESQIATVETCIRKGNDTLFLLLSKEAGDASASATTAHKEADAAGVVAGNAQRKAGDALDQSNAANDAAGKAKETAGAAAKLADEANKKTETARLTASRMQDALRPRVAGTNGEQNDELELFAGTKAAIVFSTEAEPRDLTANIIGILQRARWNVLSAAPNSPLLADPQPAKILGGKNVTIVPMTGGGLRDGVFVIARTDGPPRPSMEAARLLCYILKDNHVGCDMWWPAIYQASHWPKDVPLDAVLILVGRKPTAYLKWADNPDAQEAFTRIEKERETMSEDEKRDRNNILERRREFLGQRTPKPN
jgi:hypothetical protein